MDCREAQRLVGNFIEDTLESKKLPDFLEHVESCEACKEELSIQFLVHEGLQRLGEGSTFDLQYELQQKLESAKRRVRRKKRLAKALYYGELGAILLILTVTIMVMVL